jgi:hypothetical protein
MKNSIADSSFCTAAMATVVGMIATIGLERSAINLNRGIERSRYRGGSGGGWVIRME